MAAAQHDKISHLPEKAPDLRLVKFLTVLDLHFYYVFETVPVDSSCVVEEAEFEQVFGIFASADAAESGCVWHEVRVGGFGYSGHLVADEVLVDSVILLHYVGSFESI